MPIQKKNYRPNRQSCLFVCLFMPVSTDIYTSWDLVVVSKFGLQIYYNEIDPY